MEKNDKIAPIVVEFVSEFATHAEILQDEVDQSLGVTVYDVIESLFDDLEDISEYRTMWELIYPKNSMSMRVLNSVFDVVEETYMDLCKEVYE